MSKFSRAGSNDTSKLNDIRPQSEKDVRIESGARRCAASHKAVEFKSRPARLSTMRGQLVNLSTTGALIKSDFGARVFSLVQVVFGSGLDCHEDALSVTAYIVRINRQEMGVEWLDSSSSAVAIFLRCASAGPATVPHAA